MGKALMSRFNLHYFAWFLTRLARKLGLFGLLGLAILLACSVFYVANFLPLNQQVKSIENQLAQSKNVSPASNFTANNKQARVADPKQLSTQNSQVTQQDIERFYALFPQGVTLPRWLNTIAQTALKQGLKLNRGDYRLTAQQLNKSHTNNGRNGQFSRYEIVLPVTGRYTQIRLFITDVMRQIPALALSDLQIKRQSSSSPTVDARLVFVLLVQGDSW